MTGTELKDLREREGITQDQLAKKLGVNRFTIGRYEAMQDIPEMVSLAIRKLLE